MKKKILAVMLLAALFVTMLVGCGDSVETGGSAERRERESSTREVAAGDVQNTEVESTNSNDLSVSINLQDRYEEPQEMQQRQWVIIHIDGRGKSMTIRTETGDYISERATLDNLFVEYDKEGEICKSNINFIDYPTYDDKNNIVYTYEYSDSDLTVTAKNLDTGKTTSNEYTLTREGRIIKKNCTLIYVVDGRGTGFVKQFRDKSTETKTFSYNFVEKASDGSNEYYIRRYSDSTLGSFAVRESNKMTAYGSTANLPTEVIYVTDGKESSCYVKEDEYGNIVMTESDQIFYFTYAYLTIDEYMNYLETGDLEGIKVSGYTGSNYNYENILSELNNIDDGESEEYSIASTEETHIDKSGWAQAYLDRIDEEARQYGEFEYNLIYLDDDEIPELVSELSDSCLISVYTWKDGQIYTMMDNWSYGAYGNDGYEYIEYSGIVYHRETQDAGAINYSIYNKINENYNWETILKLKTEYGEYMEEGNSYIWDTSSNSYQQITAEERKAAADNLGISGKEWKYIEGQLNRYDMKFSLEAFL